MNDTKFMNEYTEMIIEECRKALHPELRDMISRGRAFDLIKEHFGMKEKNETEAMIYQKKEKTWWINE